MKRIVLFAGAIFVVVIFFFLTVFGLAFVGVFFQWLFEWMFSNIWRSIALFLILVLVYDAFGERIKDFLRQNKII